MLTKQDLNAIGALIDTKLKNGLAPIHEDIKIIKNDVKKLRKDLDKTIDFFDKSSMSTREKVNKTRAEVGLKEVEFAY